MSDFSEAYSELKRLDEMAIDKGRALKLLDGYCESFFEHFLKCMVYNNKFNCLNHWLIEMATFLIKINEFDIKTSTGRISKKEYSDKFYNEAGETEDDMEIMLNHFILMNKAKYSIEPITNELVKRCYNVYHQLVDDVAEKMSIKNELNEENFYNIIKQYIDKTKETAKEH